MNLDNAVTHLLDSTKRVSPSQAATKVPNRPGVYCIFVRQLECLPLPFSRYLADREHRAIYVGMASKGNAPSLHKRLVEYDLKGQGDSTFFCSLGAVLGYRPPRGSLKGKKDRNNFRFSPEDKERIVAWGAEQLTVAWLELSTMLTNEIEKPLIQRIRPILNIQNNPSRIRELRELRKECRHIAIDR